MAQGKFQEASIQFQTLARAKNLQDERSLREALQYWEYAIICQPTQKDLYEEAAALCLSEPTFSVESLSKRHAQPMCDKSQRSY